MLRWGSPGISLQPISRQRFANAQVVQVQCRNVQDPNDWKRQGDSAPPPWYLIIGIVFVPVTPYAWPSLLASAHGPCRSWILGDTCSKLENSMTIPLTARMFSFSWFVMFFFQSLAIKSTGGTLADRKRKTVTHIWQTIHYLGNGFILLSMGTSYRHFTPSHASLLHQWIPGNRWGGHQGDDIFVPVVN